MYFRYLHFLDINSLLLLFNGEQGPKPAFFLAVDARCFPLSRLLLLENVSTKQQRLQSKVTILSLSHVMLQNGRLLVLVIDQGQVCTTRCSCFFMFVFFFMFSCAFVVKRDNERKREDKHEENVFVLLLFHRTVHLANSWDNDEHCAHAGFS